MKNIIITLFVLAVLVSGAYVLKNTLFTNKSTAPTTATDMSPAIATTTKPAVKTQVATTPVVDKTKTVIGSSVSKNPITAYHFGSGSDELLFIGGIHGGYEWNTVLVAYELMDYLKANPNVIPKNVKVTVVPVMNPDGLKKVTGTTEKFAITDVSQNESIVVSGRFNANTVDLNRNFDCDWKSTGVWQTKSVSGGTSAFSEPESLAVRNYVEKNKIVGAVIWYSAGDGVYSSSCGGSILAETIVINSKYASASGYNSHQSFDSYETSGDMANWMAKKSTPAISVLLSNHTDTEWNKNQKGVDALLKYYTK